jgi:hypothetical protein
MEADLPRTAGHGVHCPNRAPAPRINPW